MARPRDILKSQMLTLLIQERSKMAKRATRKSRSAMTMVKGVMQCVMKETVMRFKTMRKIEFCDAWSDGDDGT